MKLLLSSSSLLLGFISKSDSESDLILTYFPKKTLFVTASNTSDSQLLLALEAFSPPPLKLATATKNRKTDCFLILELGS